MEASASLALSLLFAGHFLADFVFQSRRMVEGKRDHARWLLVHGAEVLLVQSLALLPFLPHARSIGALLFVATTHVAIDALKVRVERRFGRRLAWFVADQLLHVAVLFVAARWMLATEIEVSRFTPHGLVPLAWTAGLYAFNVNGGSAIVSAVLEGLRPGAKAGAAGNRAGRLIGILERMAMLTLVALGEWSALGFILAAKSVARFKELEDREFAEAYLVGTLTSFLVAGASGLLLRALVR